MILSIFDSIQAIVQPFVFIRGLHSESRDLAEFLGVIEDFVDGRES